ncbi:MAG TPA: helix-turn-helix domain-containing protein [Sedimentisphaerales bacterium]|jgi:excisionase family DNA binding protein|nr:helix-turn-helix domain-containing protein [Sedimentisphaerales bacterium]HNU29214.1 helix-turn-helix domain-containing protein [Sedimentisphaerales bacterium]
MAMTEQNVQPKQQCRCRSLDAALAISARELAEMLGISLRQVWRLSSAGKLPRPLKVGGSVRWDRDEILRWFREGCPDRRTWEVRKAVLA